MDAVLTEEQQALAEAAQALAASGLVDARTTLDGGDVPARPTEDLFDGFNGLGIDEQDGGAGGSLIDLAIVARELGRTVCPTPWVSHQLALQAAVAAGVDVGEGLSPGARWVLSTGGLVRDAATATHAVTVTGDELAVAPVLDVTLHAPMDRTRSIGELTLGAPSVIAATGGRAGVSRARALVAAGLCGTGLGAIERAIGHATQREQFGKVIGVFQGVSHQLAEAWTHVELAWSLALYACWATEEGAGDAAAAVDAATAKAGNAAIYAAERGMQVHGGIGITWEADPHLFLRRAMADDAWLGGAREAERSLGQALLTG